MAKILVVDDSEILCELFALQLRAVGHDVHIAENGVLARQAAMRERPDVIVTNVDMPLLNGFELLTALRQDDAARSIPVIFISSNTDYARKAKDLGAAAFLGKPVSGDQLRSVVAAHLPLQ